MPEKIRKIKKTEIDTVIRAPGRPRKIDKDCATVEQFRKLASTLNYEQLADYFGVSSSTLFAFMKKYPEYQDSYRRGKAEALDDVASALKKTALDGNVGAQQFYLKARGGWAETQKIEVSQGEKQDIDFDKLTEEEAETLRKLLKAAKADG